MAFRMDRVQLQVDHDGVLFPLPHEPLVAVGYQRVVGCIEAHTTHLCFLIFDAVFQEWAGDGKRVARFAFYHDRCHDKAGIVARFLLHQIKWVRPYHLFVAHTAGGYFLVAFRHLADDFSFF